MSAERAMAIPSGFIGALCDGSSGNPELERKVVAVFIECFELWKKRQKKYGTGNISAYADLGCLVRDSDKTARLRRFYLEDVPDDFDDESVVDAWRDKVNYSLMGLMCFLGEWPEVLSGETVDAS